MKAFDSCAGSTDWVPFVVAGNMASRFVRLLGASGNLASCSVLNYSLAGTASGTRFVLASCDLTSRSLFNCLTRATHWMSFIITGNMPCRVMRMILGRLIAVGCKATCCLFFDNLLIGTADRMRFIGHFASCWLFERLPSSSNWMTFIVAIDLACRVMRLIATSGNVTGCFFFDNLLIGATHRVRFICNFASRWLIDRLSGSANWMSLIVA